MSWSLPLLIFASSFAAAEIDLGTLNVEGELRRPPVMVIRSNKRFNKMLKSLAAQQLQKYEKTLVKPITYSQFLELERQRKQANDPR